VAKGLSRAKGDRAYQRPSGYATLRKLRFRAYAIALSNCLFQKYPLSKQGSFGRLLIME